MCIRDRDTTVRTKVHSYNLYPALVGTIISNMDSLDAIAMLSLVCQSLRYAFGVIVQEAWELPFIGLTPAEVAEACKRRDHHIARIDVPSRPFRGSMIVGALGMARCCEFMHLDMWKQHVPHARLPVRKTPECPFCRARLCMDDGVLECSQPGGCHLKIVRRWGRMPRSGDLVLPPPGTRGVADDTSLLKRVMTLTGFMTRVPRGKGGHPKVRWGGQLLFGVRNRIHTMTMENEMREMRFVFITETLYTVCGIDQDGYLALLCSETGDVRQDLRLEHDLLGEDMSAVQIQEMMHECELEARVVRIENAVKIYSLDAHVLDPVDEGLQFTMAAGCMAEAVISLKPSESQ
eukprot:TRINITY_DN6843_c0_g1_i1.p1 TRINITY_DN6843_c0_g1~~TRINITY_DN6843_c0_g1_i1.p1  ORF type:complete len:348 (-),score=64.26 TRINITY_DN6843_c0_g1_i1:273-1316(-)